MSVTIAAPSFVATNIGQTEKDTKGFTRPGSATDGVDYMTPQNAAQIILDGTLKRKAFVPVGRVATLSNAMNRIAPSLFLPPNDAHNWKELVLGGCCQTKSNWSFLGQ